MKKSKLNRDWHHEHEMPVKATMEQRLEWHLEHARNCGCQPIPVKIAEEMKKRRMSKHNNTFKRNAAKSRRAP